MVEAGEAAGILDEVLDRVAFQIEKATQIKRRVKGAMLYPTMVLIFASLVLMGLLMFLVPVFVRIFGQLGGELPTLTQYVVAASDLLRKTVVAVIGPMTADAARQAGIPVTIQPASYTIPALVDAIAAHYAKPATRNV